MAEDPLVEQLADAWIRANSVLDPPILTGRDRAERVYAAELVSFALSWLAEQGRLVPDGATVQEQWAVRDWGSLMREPPAITGDLTEQVARRYAKVLDEVDAIHRQVITTPWVAVPAEEASADGGERP